MRCSAAQVVRAMGNASGRRIKGSDSKAGEDGDGLSFEASKARVCLDDFVLLKTVGKGSFGKVIQVPAPC